MISQLRPESLTRLALYLAWVASAACCAFFLAAAQEGRPGGVARESYRDVAYRGSPGDCEPVVISSPPAAALRRLELCVSFVIDHVEPGAYANVFQTADGNAGFRLEANAYGDLCLIAGAPTADNPGGWKGVSLRLRPRPGGWHTLRISLEDGTAHINFDGADHWLRHLRRVTASRFLLGNGYDGTRPLIGHAALERLDWETATDTPLTRREVFVIWLGRGLSLGTHLFILALLVVDVRRTAAASPRRFFAGLLSPSSAGLLLAYGTVAVTAALILCLRVGVFARHHH